MQTSIAKVFDEKSKNGHRKQNGQIVCRIGFVITGVKVESFLDSIEISKS